MECHTEEKNCNNLENGTSQQIYDHCKDENELFFMDLDLKKKSWIGKSPTFFSEPGINEPILGENYQIGDDSERVIETLIEEFALNISPEIQNEGPQGLKLWIFENMVDKKFGQNFIRKYFRKKDNVTPATLMKICIGIEKFIQECGRFYDVEPHLLTMKQLTNMDMIPKVMDKITNSVEQHYIYDLISMHSLNNGRKFQLNKRKIIEFNHPMVNKYGSYLKKKGTQEESINNVVINLKRYFTWSCSVLSCFQGYSFNEVPVWLCTRDHLKQYKNYLVKRIKNGDITANAAKQHFVYIKSFFFYLYCKEDIAKDITRALPNIVASSYKYRYIPTKIELQCFFDTVNRYAQHPILESLAYSLMLYLGMRIEEVVKLKGDDFNMDTKTVTFLGKGKVSAKLPIPSILESSLVSQVSGSDYLFGDPKKSKNILKSNFKIYKLVSGITEDGNVHLLRHTFITSMSKYCNPRTLQKVSRHKSLTTLSNYLHHDERILIDAVNNINLGKGGDKIGD